MAARAAKLRRLNDFRRDKPHCSANSLAKIMNDIRHNGLPELSGNRNHFREARDLIVLANDSLYGPVITKIQCETIDGELVDIPVSCPFASLQKALNDSDNFRRFMKQALLATPPSHTKPWSVVLYSDEVTPGNPLAINNPRKFQSIYWSFLEFGASALSHEESWFIATIELSKLVNTLSAGLSQLFKEVIKLFFKPGSFHFMESGMNIEIDGEVFRLFAKIGVVLQDGGAHKAVWLSRGDGASRFCLLCKNMFTDDSELVDEDGTHLLRCNVIKLDELEASTDKELRANALEVQSSILGAGGFTEMQKLSAQHTRNMDCFWTGLWTD